MDMEIFRDTLLQRKRCIIEGCTPRRPGFRVECALIAS
ncbi:hypothetical protein M7I_2930 [Glarea lozoyensis 74030]|uniref:Uncharacterized protein n=1 Tax=Glarea lozoyensis (strain ATCC 74030 / MF5533) TaxID=1104152 RepID=H0EK39_GLAL7|nr:hypothetical protein M7I_2930 [Glarea lozoyensis 74030]